MKTKFPFPTLFFISPTFQAHFHHFIIFSPTREQKFSLLLSGEGPGKWKGKSWDFLAFFSGRRHSSTRHDLSAGEFLKNY